MMRLKRLESVFVEMYEVKQILRLKNSRNDSILLFRFQRIVKMNKTEDDEMDAQELTEDELKTVAGVSFMHTSSVRP